MADLEEAGLLWQPHTSAGRVPTDRGYRFYVDSLLPPQRISSSDERVIRETLQGGAPELAELLERASRLLSRLSRNLGIVVAPGLSKTVLKHVEFLRLHGRRVLALFVSKSGALHNRVVELDENIPQEELTRMGNFLSERFSGKTLPQVRQELLRLMSEEKALYDRLLQRAMELGVWMFEQSEDLQAGVFIEGTSNLLARAGTEGLEPMRDLFRAFEDKHHIVQVLNQCLTSEGVQVLIGSENPAPELRPMSLVMSSYRSGNNPVGTLGVVGPMRMEYARAVALVDAIARACTEALQERSN
jgi:heat-inducible transcriptional repressor